MKVLIVSGIWPPDVGGPASHSPELARFLISRGHEVRAITTTENGPPADPGFPLRSARRDRSRVVRVTRGALAIVAAAPGAEVIYSSGMYVRCALASILYRVPLVLKLTGDPAFDRARALGLFSGTLEEFQQRDGGPSINALKRLRSFGLSRASRIVVPSAYMAAIACAWGLPEELVMVVPNSAPVVDRSISRDALRRRLGLSSPTFVFAGRLVPAKNLPMLISAIDRVPRGSLVVIGDGPEREHLARLVAQNGGGARIRMMGALPRSEVIEWVRAADAAVLTSDWENFPHAAVEALAAGTPVVATAVGGVPEIVESGINGILTPARDPRALAEALNSLIDDPELLTTLRTGADSTAARYRPEPLLETIEAELEWAVADGRGSGA